MVGNISDFRAYRRQFGFVRSNAPLEVAMFNVMRIMAFGADKPAFFTRALPFADALAVNTIPPITKDVAVTFAAQKLRLIVTDRIAEIVD